MSSRPALLIVAHPDDEVIGAGALLTRVRRPIVVQVTDGRPGGYGPDYAALRDAEAARALSLARAEPVPRLCLGFTDQTATFQIAEIAERLALIFARLKPRFVLTHPYEGGHPDHDATACAVHLAARLSTTKVRVAEFASYHWREHHMVTGEFLANGGRVRTWALGALERGVKRAMIEAHASQADVLRDFGVDVERFRLAPKYDFTRPPHPGRLFYENFQWGVTGDEWRALARRALTSDTAPSARPRGAGAIPPT